MAASQLVRDTFLVRALTGLHGTEVERLASGAGSVRVVDDPAGIKAVLTVRHKNGHEHTISVGSQVWAALEWLRKRSGSASSSTMHEALRRVGVHAGRLRHTFATLALTAGQLVHPVGTSGLSRATVAEALGHSPATNRRYYDGVAVPPMVVLPLRLHHGEPG